MRPSIRKTQPATPLPVLTSTSFFSSLAFSPSILTSSPSRCHAWSCAVLLRKTRRVRFIRVLRPSASLISAFFRNNVQSSLASMRTSSLNAGDSGTRASSTCGGGRGARACLRSAPAWLAAMRAAAAAAGLASMRRAASASTSAGRLTPAVCWGGMWAAWEGPACRCNGREVGDGDSVGDNKQRAHGEVSGDCWVEMLP